MKVEEKLTEEQQKLLEENMGLIISFLKLLYDRKKLQLNDWDSVFDCLQLRMCKAIKNYNPCKAKISTYMYRCFYREFVQFIKRKTKRNRITNFTDINCGDTDSLEIYDKGLPVKANNQKIEKLMCLAHLPVRSKKVIRRYYVKDYTLKTIGKEIGLSKERIRQVLVESINSMRYACLQNNFSYEDFLIVDHYIDRDEPYANKNFNRKTSEALRR